MSYFYSSTSSSSTPKKKRYPKNKEKKEELKQKYTEYSSTSRIKLFSHIKTLIDQELEVRGFDVSNSFTRKARGTVHMKYTGIVIDSRLNNPFSYKIDIPYRFDDNAYFIKYDKSLI